jgi:heterodisulfide reductase subunit D
MSIHNYSLRQLLEIEACTRCSLCADICPAVAASRDGLLSGMYRIHRLKEIQRLRYGISGILRRFSGRGKITSKQLKEYGDTVFRCTLCGSCQETCPVGIRMKDLWISLRQDIVHSGHYPENADVIGDNLAKSKNVFAEDNGERADWIENIRDIQNHHLIRDSAEVVYFTGCVASYFPMAQRIPMALIEILELFGVDFTLLGKDEWCCGYPLLGAGQMERCQEIIDHNIEVTLGKSAKKVIFSCPSCYRMWHEYYPHDFEIYHATQYLLELISNNSIALKEVSMVVTYHDPCDLGRGSRVFEEPREIIRSIPGVKLLEMERNREKCLCCGGGGNLEMMDARLSAEIARLKIEEVLATGAEAVVTSCQQCVRTMNTFVKRNKISLNVMDITNLLQQALIP